jgi:hypothetical protein
MQSTEAGRCIGYDVGEVGGVYEVGPDTAALSWYCFAHWNKMR